MVLNITNDTMDHHNSTVNHNILEQNCREGWPLWTCIFANVCGMCSTTLWFIVLLPQVWKNFRRKSVKGLSVLWATANFTASLINLFFVFIFAKIPLYGQISSIYCPILEFCLLCQFWIYGRYRKIEKVVYAGICFVLWAIIIITELVFEVENFIEYVAILLWCIETFPQVLLNMRLQSTSGQATGSVAIAMTGKTTDFFATNILVMPLQYVIMCYFSSSVAYVNGFQVAWYYGRDFTIKNENGSKEEKQQQTTHGNLNDSSYSINSHYKSTSNIIPSMTKGRNTCTLVVRVLCMTLISLLLLMCVVGFVLNVRSLFGLFAPASIILILSVAHVYFSLFKRSNYALNGESK